MIREDRKLLTELVRLNTAMTSLALRIMEGSASAAEQQDYAQRLIAAGQLEQGVESLSGKEQLELEGAKELAVRLLAMALMLLKQHSAQTAKVPIL